MIKTNVEYFRDPFVLIDDGVYYAYGTGITTWDCYKNTSGRLDGEWKKTNELVYVEPQYAVKDRWAPEVHKYKGNYYMFATYYSSLTNHRGCTILKSASPEGPFVEITDGHITPKEWDAIDGTFYVDKDGQPWMIFVHEWTCTDDGIGRMAAAKLSDDLTHFISEPVELFRADDPAWTNKRVTDGCFMYESADNGLIMIWSNFDDEGNYCVGVAHSDNGCIDGKWTQDASPMFSKKITGKYDGGHAMIFKDNNGKIYMSLHSPNRATEGCVERMVFVPIKEENGTLVCDM